MDAELRRETNDFYFGSPWHGGSDDQPCEEFVAGTDKALNGQPACARCGFTAARHPHTLDEED